MQRELTAAMEGILDEAIAIAGATFGNIQVLNPKLQGMEIVAQRGFDEAFLEKFRIVRVDDPSACGRALRLGRRIMISDVASDPYYAPFVSVALRAGYRAVHSTPCVGRHGSAIGVLSTHFARIHQVPQETAQRLDACAAGVVDLIEQYVPELATMRSA